MNLINKKYKIINKIGCGSFGSIYKGINIRTQEEVAIKIESIQSQLKLLKNESTIYQFLTNNKGIPQVKWFGRDETNYYMVIELLGNSLQRIKETSNTFSLNLTMQIGIQILLLLKTIHDKGLVHRDIKPDNFLIGVGNNKKYLYIIDFGFCKTVSNDNTKKVNSLIGSLTYASINAHNFIEQNYRDDLESLGYMLLYFLVGNLDWQDDILEDIHFDEKNRLVCAMKEATCRKKETPSIIVSYLEKIRILGFNQTPDYNELIELFKREIK